MPFTPPEIVLYTEEDDVPECDGDERRSSPTTRRSGVETNRIVFDDTFAEDLYSRFGDMAVGYPIATAYSDAVRAGARHRLLTGERRAQLSDCLAGVWIRDIIPAPGSDPDARRHQRQPGDLVDGRRPLGRQARPGHPRLR